MADRRAGTLRLPRREKDSAWPQLTASAESQEGDIRNKIESSSGIKVLLPGESVSPPNGRLRSRVGKVQLGCGSCGTLTLGQSSRKTLDAGGGGKTQIVVVPPNRPQATGGVSTSYHGSPTSCVSTGQTEQTHPRFAHICTALSNWLRNLQRSFGGGFAAGVSMPYA